MQFHVGLYFLSNSFLRNAAISFSMWNFSMAWTNIVRRSAVGQDSHAPADTFLQFRFSPSPSPRVGLFTLSSSSTLGQRTAKAHSTASFCMSSAMSVLTTVDLNFEAPSAPMVPIGR